MHVALSAAFVLVPADLIAMSDPASLGLAISSVRFLLPNGRLSVRLVLLAYSWRWPSRTDAWRGALAHQLCDFAQHAAQGRASVEAGDVLASVGLGHCFAL